MIRAILRFLLSKKTYSRIKKYRLIYLDIYFSLNKQLAIYFRKTANFLFYFSCKIKYKIKIRDKNSYFKKSTLTSDLLKSFSALLNNLDDSWPLLLGHIKNHESINIIEISKQLNGQKIQFKRNYIYGPSQLQILMRSDLGQFLEEKIGSRPFIYNTQICKIFKNSKGEFTLPISHQFTQKSYGDVKGFFLFNCSTLVPEKKIIYKNIRLNVAEVELEKEANFIEFSNLDRKNYLQFNGNSNNDFLELIYIHAIPSMNRQIICQQAGWDTVVPNFNFSPIIPVMPIINIPNKDHLFEAILKKEIIGLNLGGAGHVFPGWISIDTRYGYENTPNLLPMWLDKDHPLPFESNSIDFAYSSHFFEHVNDQVCEFLLREVFRILKPKGLFLIILPNFEKALDCYKQNDWSFIDNSGFGNRADTFSINHIPPSFEMLTASMFSGSSTIIAKNGLAQRWQYDGAPKIPKDELRKILTQLSPKEISNYLNQKTDADVDLTEHVNAFSENEIKKKLESLGYNIIDPAGGTIDPLLKSIAPHKNKWEYISMNIAVQKP